MKNKSHPSTALERYKFIRPFLEEETSMAALAIRHNIGLRSIKRWVKAYKTEGLSGLQRKVRATKGQRKIINEELIKLVEGLVLQKPPLTLTAIHRKVVKVAQQKKLKEPTYYVVRDIAQKMNKGLVVLSQQGSKAYNQEFELIYRRESTAPNEMWQADHTPLDIVLIDEKGIGQKPWLTIIIAELFVVSFYPLMRLAPYMFPWH
jgi:putative transposase